MLKKDSKIRLFEMMERIDKTFKPNINEIDWEKDFSDVQKTCLNLEELKNYLNMILENYNLPSNKRKKPDLIIHNKSIPFDENGEIDVKEFINNISQLPPQIISQNAKMEKSSNNSTIVINMGIPALEG